MSKEHTEEIHALRRERRAAWRTIYANQLQEIENRTDRGLPIPPTPILIVGLDFDGTGGYSLIVDSSGLTVYSECCSDQITSREKIKQLIDGLTAYLEME